MITWLKGQQWFVTLGLVLGAILLALAGARSVKQNNRAQKNEDAAVDLMNSGIASDIAKAEKMSKKAEKNKVAAAKAKLSIHAQLEKLGEANEDIDDIAARFNSRRVRRSG